MSFFLTSLSTAQAANRNRSREDAGFFRSMLSAARRNRERRLTINALQSLDDATLADIGLRRSEILRAASEAVSTDAQSNSPTPRSRNARHGSHLAAA